MENIPTSQLMTAGDNEFAPLFGLSIPDAWSGNTVGRSSVSLVEQLQTTLEIEELLEIFSMEAAKSIRFCGLSLQYLNQTSTVRGSMPGQHLISFNLLLEGEKMAQLSYSLIDPLGKNDVRKLDSLHQQLLYPLRNALMFLKVKKLALKDALTGLNNRGHFDDSLQQALIRAKRNRSTFALIMLDLDEFKQVNDNHGHLEGDKVIQAMADVLLKSVRGDDSVFRLGGDEFAIIAQGNKENDAATVSARIQHNVSNHPLLSQHGVSTSIGFTFFKQNDSIASLYSRADTALYAAKDFGRNCTKTA